jgi:Flp pilus assembly protein CpaB
VASVNQLQGATFIQGFAANQQITSAGVQLQTRTFEVPEGYEAVAVQIDFVPGGAGYVNAGDHVNLYGVFSTVTGDAAVPRAELLLTNVEVLDVDLTIPPRRGSAPVDPAQPAAQRASGTAVTYLLAVRADDAEKVVYATEFESLYASLTADDAAPAGPTPGRDGGTILAEEPNVAVNP